MYELHRIMLNFSGSCSVVLEAIFKRVYRLVCHFHANIAIVKL